MGKREDRRYGGRLAVLTFVLLCLQGTGGQAYAQEDKAGERRIRYSSSYLKEAEIPEAPEEYLEEGRISLDKVQKAVADRQVFPCYFGSALHSQGVEELLDGLDLYIKDKTYPAEFGAKVYKIARDNQGNRLTYLKVTGGRLKVKDVVEGLNEKINQIRIYSGEKYETVNELQAGRICAVTGLSDTIPFGRFNKRRRRDLNPRTA